VEPSTSSPEGSLAPTSQAPASSEESLGKKADFGQRWPDALAFFDPDMCSWKTAQCSLSEDFSGSLEILPTWGMTRDGVLSELNTSARLTNAQGYGVLRNLSQAKAQGKPTTDCNVPGAASLYSEAVNVTIGNGSAVTAESGPTHSTMKNGTVANGAAPPMWPTPQANEDAAGTPAGKMQPMLGNHPMVRGNTPLEWKRGTLNPAWVEWLMGVPPGWTDLKPLETHRYQQWLRLHGVS
jgi:DNA (cytosine-5)-methyltransferase 1